MGEGQRAGEWDMGIEMAGWAGCGPRLLSLLASGNAGSIVEGMGTFWGE